MIIIIHELGHVLSGLYYKWDIKKVILLPFGGITIFNIHLNNSMKEEFIVAISGPLFQFIISNIINIFLKNNLFMTYNYMILLFNLIPIIPLDGSKITALILNKLFPYRVSIFINIIISLITIIFFVLKFNILIYIIILFLLVKVLKELIERKEKYNKFLLERYLYNFCFKKSINVNNINNFKKGYYHYINNVPEKLFLDNYFF